MLAGYGMAGTDGGVATAIAQGAGSAIGGMTANGGLAAGYDGDTNQAAVASATSSATTSGFVLVNSIGKDWGAGIVRTISKVVVTAPNNNPVIAAVRNYKLQGSTDNFSASTVDLTAGIASTNINGEVLTMQGVTIDTSQSYRYHRFIVDGNGAVNTFVCEIVWYEDL